MTQLRKIKAIIYLLDELFCSMIVLCKKLGINVENLPILTVDNCDTKLSDLESEFTIFTCPGLYHQADKLDNYEVLDLRVLKAFKNPNDVAKALLISELIYTEKEIEVVETGEDVVYVGDNLEIIRELALHCNLTVITQNHKTIKKLYPYEIRVINGKVIDIKGRIGNFEVLVDGIDLTNGKVVKSIKAGQIIYPNWTKKQVGVYTEDEYIGAFKALANLKGYIKVKPVKINNEICGAMKSGFIGCTFCINCPTGAIELNKKLEKIEVKLENCVGCGFCASICPLSAIQNLLLPFDVLIKKIDTLAEKFDGTLAFVCRNALSDLSNYENLDTIYPILVPCINSISEVHYLYAVLRGFNVVVIPCDCDHLRLNCFEIAKETLKAFGFGGLAITSWDKLNETLEKLKKERRPNIKVSLNGKNKRLQWLNLVEKLMDNLQVTKIETQYFGKIKINDNCTLCNTCKNFCPSNAIKKADGKILFIHALCIACRLCVQACPENAIDIENVLDFKNLHEQVIFEDEMIKCPKCGKPHISKKAYEKIKSLIGIEKSLLFCAECRPKMIFEALYEEMIKDRWLKHE
ncbi:MAG TPA: 4Fe-4S dicluster domain-containing protein [Archaeoglobus profundus]|nr:4Fe-4S dicluster domain-containing protein [Archaeoglobus profundus]